tara:strand:- start:135 stop:476 length:342 start_codon:yes stop_codon:yes gene_type:complete
MIFAHCSIIQEGEAALFYRFNRPLNGYMIAGLLIAPNTAAKLAFAKIWKYFVSEVVTSDDIYCSILIGTENSLFDNYLTYHSDIDGLKIYKVDNFLKDKYSSYAKHLEGQNSG